jgi:hypothetical protein
MLGLFSQSAFSQAGVAGKFEIKTEKDPATGDIKVILTPLDVMTAPVPGDNLFDITFFVMWSASYGSQIDLDPASLTNAKFNLGIQPTRGEYDDPSNGLGVDYYFRSFARNAINVFPITAAWPVGAPITLLCIKPLQNGVVVPVGDFTIANITTGPINGGPAGNVEAFSNVSLEKGGVLDDYLPTVTGFATAVPLPVELIGFEAKANKTSIDLDWRTSYELNFKGFGVERSIDGKGFEQLDFIQNKGNQSGSDYSYEDRTAQIGKLYYYRLRMLDNDGKSSFSSTKSAMIEATKTHVSIYPNPSDGNINLEYYLEEETNTQIDVYDMTGKLVLHKAVEAQKDKNLVSINMLDLPSGLYSIQINMNNKTETKMVKIAKK